MFDWAKKSQYTPQSLSTMSSSAQKSLPTKVTVETKEPIDLGHHFSRVTQNRKESSIKEFYKYFAIPGIGNLAGGTFRIDYSALRAQPPS